MERITAILLLSFIGLSTVFSLADGCNCNVNHPQQKFCNASFVFAGEITNIEYVDVDGQNFMRYTFQYLPHEVYKGKHLLSRDRFNQTVHTPYWGSLCGRPDLARNTKYLISGTVEGGILEIGYCNWIDEWYKITDTQELFLRDGVYASNCGGCKIPGAVSFNKLDQNRYEDYTNSLQMSGYWTMRMCHYNPIASAYYRTRDCEGELSYCSYNKEANMCLWKMSDSFEKCFIERETMWQIKEGAAPAFTSIRQCRDITTKKLKKKCKRIILKKRKLQREQKKQARLQQEREEEVQLPFDLDLDY